MMFADPPSKDWRVIPDNQESLTTKFYERLKVKGKVSHSVVSDSFVTPWTVTHQAHLFMGFSRQVYWSGLPCPPSEDLPNPGIELTSLTSPTLVSRFFTASTWEAGKSWGKWGSELWKYQEMHVTMSHVNIWRSLGQKWSRSKFKGPTKDAS